MWVGLLVGVVPGVRSNERNRRHGREACEKGLKVVRKVVIVLIGIVILARGDSGWTRDQKVADEWYSPILLYRELVSRISMKSSGFGVASNVPESEVVAEVFCGGSSRGVPAQRMGGD